MKLLVLHGPNLNLLGEGEAGERLEDLDAALRERAAALGVALEVVQSNHEGALLDALHAARHGLGGVVVNPAGLFGSHPLKEALEAVGAPAIEVSLGAPREGSVVAEACVARLGGRGRGFKPYLDALERLARGEDSSEEDSGEEDSGEEDSEEDSTGDEAPQEDSASRKTLGRKGKAPALALARAAEAGPTKSLGRKAEPPAQPRQGAGPGKSLGRASRQTAAADLLTRALVRQRIAERLGGRLTPEELAAWARTRWQEVQRGGPAEAGHREQLEEALQRLTLSHLPASGLSEAQLVDLMTRLDA